MKKVVVLALSVIVSCRVMAQAKLSFATDISGLGNFSPQQHFFALGQTVQLNVHLTPKNSFYSWFTYHSPGRFDNNYTAVAKSSTTTPATINYKVEGIWKMREFSLGWKRYFKGAYNTEYGWNLYGIAGLGLMFTRAENIFDPVVDTALYTVPATPVSGQGTISRLTVDLGLGGEIPLGGDFFVYGDLRTYLPASSYPSPYLHSTKDVPLPVMVNLGLRILFFNY